MNNLQIKETVYIVDDDPAVTGAIQTLLNSNSANSETYHSAESFLENYDGKPGCLVLDVRLPGMSGVLLQRHLHNNNNRIPIIFISGHSDIPTAVKSIQQGAAHFLTKPFNNQELLDTIHLALNNNQKAQKVAKDKAAIQMRANTLTQRERQLLQGISQGKQTKEIASDLNISLNTAQIHRANVMKKMDAKNLGHLIKMILNSDIRHEFTR